MRGWHVNLIGISPTHCRRIMDPRSQLSLTSTWKTSADLHCVLYIKSSSGNLLEQPLASEQEHSLLLTQPDSTDGGGDPCYLRLELQGYLPTALELTSSSRTVEVYSGDDYISTNRGTFVRNTEDGFKLYTCELEIPPEKFHCLNLKLLSLRGRTEVKIDRLELMVTEDRSGVSSSDSAAPRYDVEQMLGSLPTQNLPPFLQTLVSSLQYFQTEKPTPVPSDPHSAVPAELSQMAAAFRQLRPLPPVTNSNADREEPQTETDHDKERRTETDQDVLSTVDMAAIEKRLERYIDDKFDCLQKQINERFEELAERLLQQHTSQQMR